MLGLLSLLSGHDCFAGIPVWSDELDYWREMYSFASSSDGAFGYYGFDGYPAAVGEWGCHGIAPLLVYGPFALTFGWGAHSIVVCNGFFCMACVLVFCALLRPSSSQAVLMAVLWMAYPPLLLYAPSSMMELPQYGCFFLYLACALRYARDKRVLWLVLAFACVIYMAGLRLSNIVLFAPLVLLFSGFKPRLRFWALAAVSLAASFACYKFFWLFSAGYPAGFLAALGAGDGAASGPFELLLAHAAQNVQLFFSRGDGAAQISQRLAFALAFGGCVFFAGVSAVAQRMGIRVNVPLMHACVACAFVLGLVWVVVIFAYDVFDWRDYRTLAPFLFAVFVTLIMAAHDEHSGGSDDGTVADAPVWVQRMSRLARVHGLALMGVVCIACDAVLLVCAIGSISGSASFEDERYELMSAAEAAHAGSIELEPVDDGMEGRTMLLVDGSLPRWLAFGASPEIGFVSVTDRSGDGASYGYAFAPAAVEPPLGYERVWENLEDGSVIYRGMN